MCICIRYSRKRVRTSLEYISKGSRALPGIVSSPRGESVQQSWWISSAACAPPSLEFGTRPWRVLLGACGRNRPQRRPGRRGERACASPQRWPGYRQKWKRWSRDEGIIVAFELFIELDLRDYMCSLSIFFFLCFLWVVILCLCVSSLLSHDILCYFYYISI